MHEITDDDVALVNDTLARLTGDVFAAIASPTALDENVLTVGPYSITSRPFVSEMNPRDRVFSVKHEAGWVGDYLRLPMAVEALACDTVKRFLETPAT